MHIDFRTLRLNGEWETVSEREWECVPRLGDTVWLDGSQFGQDESESFLVHEVAHDNGDEVIVYLRPIDSYYVPYCTCDTPSTLRGPTAGPDGTMYLLCSDCDGRLRVSLGAEPAVNDDKEEEDEEADA